MYRTHHCGQLRLIDSQQKVKMSGWVHSVRDKGALIWIILRDRYGFTQLILEQGNTSDELIIAARKLSREFVISIEGLVKERYVKNPNMPTGEVEVWISKLEVINPSALPPFTIEEETDGGDDIRMKYRYLDLRRPQLQRNMIFRSKLSFETRRYLHDHGFLEIETPFLIKSTPEGARDFVVPSRMNEGQFYALPQSPQTFKQLLMVSGYDKYFQIVKCFRDEDLRADRQPEFTQIDCEMAFVTQEDILNTFEGLTQHLFKTLLEVDLGTFPRITYDEAMRLYGIDKPDLRFGMPIVRLENLAKGHGFGIFDDAAYIGGICAENCAETFSNKDIKSLTEWVKRPQVGAGGLVWVKWNEDGLFKSSASKFYTDEILKQWFESAGGKQGDMLFLLSGSHDKTEKQMGLLRLELARLLQKIEPGDFKPLWVVDFPLLEWDEESSRFYAMHHPFTSPKPEDRAKLKASDFEVLKSLKADAYDLVINGTEIGGGSIRIHDRSMQMENFEVLGFTQEEAEAQFGFLLGAFEYGAPPHGGIAFGFDRLCALMKGQSSIRDFIAFPKNNQGRDIMLDAPSDIDSEQLKELNLSIDN